MVGAAQLSRSNNNEEQHRGGETQDLGTVCLSRSHRGGGEKIKRLQKVERRSKAIRETAGGGEFRRHHCFRYNNHNTFFVFLILSRIDVSQTPPPPQVSLIAFALLPISEAVFGRLFPVYAAAAFGSRISVVTNSIIAAAMPPIAKTPIHKAFAPSSEKVTVPAHGATANAMLKASE